MSNRDIINLVPQGTIDSALRVDAEVLTNTPDEAKVFIDSNRTEYTIAINTWIGIIQTYSKYGWKYILDRISKDGLRKTVFWTCEYASAIIANNAEPTLIVGYELLWSIYQDVLFSYNDNRFFHPDDAKQLSALQTFLTILRYLKRMSPNHATKLRDDALADFYANQKRLKERDRGISRRDCQFVIDLVKDEVRKLNIKDRVKRFGKLDIHDIVLTHGTAYDSKADLVSKLHAISRVCPDYFRNTEHFISAFFPIYMGYTLDHVKMMTVPKSLKTDRTIAMESTYRQACAKSMFLIWQDTLPAAIHLHDQSVNQELARIGSLDGAYATIDLHAASDSVKYSLVREIYPNEFCEFLDLVRPRVVDCDGRQPSLLISWATMGNSLTFILESEVFYLICMAAIHFHERHFGSLGKYRISIYGDDIVVPSEAAPTVIAFLEALGFRVNSDKTFIDGRYRESCGKEYAGGEDWSSIYFPRFPVSNNLLTANRDSRADTWHTDFSRLLELQHKLFTVSHEAAMWLADFLLQRKARLAVVNPGSDIGTDKCVWGLDFRFTSKRLLKRYVYLSWSQWEDYRFIQIVGFYELPERVNEGAQLLEARTRYYACVPCEVLKDAKDPLLEKYLYLKYLQYGPKYEDKTLRLAGVSTPYLRKDPLNPTFEWRDLEA